MSVLLAAVNEAAIHHLASGSPLAAAGDGGGSTGLIDLITQKNEQVQVAARGLSITAALIFVIYNAVRSAFAVARIVVTGLVAALMVWITFHMTDLENRVGDEVNSMPAVSHSAPQQPTVRAAVQPPVHNPRDLPALPGASQA